MLTEKGPHGLVLVAINKTARELGLEAGLTYSDAKARVPGLYSEEIDRDADDTTLRRLASWMYRYSPIVALDERQSLILETTGCDHLFGGEKAMVTQLSDQLTHTGYTNRIGLASTPGAAHALAHAHKHQIAIAQKGSEHEALAGLPVSALRLTDQARTLLRRFGLNEIGQLYGIDRKALSRRFHSRDMADHVTLRLDQALGLRAEPLKPLRPKPAYICRLPCPEPIASGEAVRVGLEHLTIQLCADLSEQGEGARQFSFQAYKGDGRFSVIVVSAARPVRDVAHILRLFSERIDRIDPGYGIDFLTLEARYTGPMDIAPAALSSELAGSDADEAALATLSDRLTARLGDGIVTMAFPRESHIPEKAIEIAPLKDQLPDWALSQPVRGPRPIRVFDRPEEIDVLAEVPDGPPRQFRWRGIPHRVIRSDGPERLSPEWWHILKSSAPETLTRTRDYFRIEDVSGRRYWVFRQGLYEDGRGGPPAWFIQGLFA